jgi:hypothetical protein
VSEPLTAEEEALRVRDPEDQRESARAAHLFLNMVRCPDCRLPWPQGYVHDGCPAARQREGAGEEDRT